MICSICLDALQKPVVTPCGHVFCMVCLISSCQKGRDATMAPCPTCRKTLSLVIPNAIFVPEKYHPFIDSNVRRIYLDNSAELALQEQVKQLEARVKSLETQKDQLMDRCESYMQASLRHAENEKDVRTRCTALKKELKQANQSVAELTDREARRRAINESRPDNASRPTPKEGVKSNVSSDLTSVSLPLAPYVRRESNSSTSRTASPEVDKRRTIPLPKRRRTNPHMIPPMGDIQKQLLAASCLP